MWSRIPLVRLLIPFLSGVLAAEWIALPVDLTVVFMVAIPLLAGSLFYSFLYGYRTRWVQGFFIIIFMAGYGWYLPGKLEAYRLVKEDVIPSGDITCLIQINKGFEMRERSCRTRAEALSCLQGDSVRRLQASLMLYAEPDSSLSKIPPGSLLLVRGKMRLLNSPANPNEFNYRKYLARRGIFHSMYIKSDQYRLLDSLPDISLLIRAEGVRMKLLDKLKANGVEGKYFGISAALLLGEDSHLDADIRDVYARAGAMHILCVSGLHVGVVFLVLNTLFGFLRRIKPGRFILPPLLLLCIWSYALITGMAPPVSRASCMISFFIAGNLLGRHKNAYNTLAASAILLVIFDPQVLFSAGFQLSYTAVLGIISLQKPLENLLYFKYKLFARIWSITTVSIAAQLGTLPVVLYYFHQIPLYGLITNLIVIPLSSFIIYSGMLLLLLPITSIVSTWVSEVFQFLLRVMDTGVCFVESIPFGMATNIVLDLPAVMLMAFLIALFSAFLISKRKYFLILAMVCFLAFSLLRLHTKYVDQTQQSFVVYSIRGHSAYDFINGTTHHFYADSLLLCAPGKIDYSIRPHWLARGMKNTIFDTLHAPTDYDTWVIQKGHCYNVCIWQGPFPHCHPPENKPGPAYLILRGNCPFELLKVFDWFNPGLVIIDSSVPPWVITPGGDGRFWDVREKGAFVSSTPSQPSPIGGRE